MRTRSGTDAVWSSKISVSAQNLERVDKESEAVLWSLEYKQSAVSEARIY